MKSLIKKFIRTALYSMCFFCSVTFSLIISVTFNKLPLLQVVFYAAIPASLCFVAYFLATRVNSNYDIKSIKNEFKDVSHLRKRHIFLFTIVELVLLLFSVTTCYNNTLGHDVLYPNAENVLKEELNLSDSTLLLFSTLPAFVNEVTYNSAECINSCLEIYEDSNLTSDEMEKQITNLENNMRSKHNDIMFNGIIGCIFVFLFALVFDMMKRCQQYHTLMRKFDGVRNETK